ncbi:zinc knuckle CX2CX4HX4C containing protein [Tanacetum coccineum]
MRELREDTFSGNKDEDAHNHIDRVLSIVGLFNILRVSKDAVILRVFPFTLTGSAKKMGGQTRPRNYQYLGSPQKGLYPKGPIPGMRSAQALTAIQTMADHFKKWHDETTSRNIGSSSSNNRLAALGGCQICEGPHLDKDCPLNEEVKQVEEIRYGEFRRTTPFNGNNRGKFRVGPPGYYTKTDNRPPYGEKRQSLEELLAKHQEESARRSTEMEVWIKKLQENAEINTRNQSASLKNLETQIEQLTKELHSRKEKSKQANVVIVEHEGPSSPKKLKNLHGISFLYDSQEENTNDQLPTKESNPGHFTLPCTIVKQEILGNGTDMRKKEPLGIVRDILVKIDKFLFPSDFVILDQTSNSTIILGRPFLATIHANISVFEKEISKGIGDEKVEDSVWSKRYSEWCNENSHDKKPRPRDYTFKEWVKLKKGHLDISKLVRKDLFRSWVIDQFTKALDPDKDPLERCLD